MRKARTASEGTLRTAMVQCGGYGVGHVGLRHTDLSPVQKLPSIWNIGEIKNKISEDSKKRRK